MRIAFILSLILVTVTAVSCKTLKDDSDTTAPAPLDFEVIQSNALMGGGSEGIEESIVVCNAEIDLYNISQKMNSVNYSTQGLDDMEINFEKETLIGYFQPVRSSGGYSLTAESLTQVDSDGTKGYLMHYSLTTPQGAATMALTQPFIFVKTKKIQGDIKYKVTEK